MKKTRTVNLGYAEARNTNLSPGDLDKNYAGAISPSPKHLANDEGTRDNETPEWLMIWKERWETVAEIISSNPDLCENLELTMDYFAGYSWADLAEKYGMTKGFARYRVKLVVSYLQKKIIGRQF